MTFKNYMPYTEGEKRYHTLSYDLSHRFGGRVWKAAVDAGFTCPNRDGTKGRNGCSFCAGGSGDFTPASLLRQWNRFGWNSSAYGTNGRKHR